eukprot:335928_1
MIQVAVLLLCVFIAHSTELEDDRKKWFNRINKYELIHIDIGEGNIQFDALGNHYNVKLTVNELVSSPILLHSNGDKVARDDKADDQCYYHGEVLNAEKSRVTLSGCEGDGFHGIIHAFGNKLYIRPSSYYHAPYNYTSLRDEHLVYKSSDYNWKEEQAEWGELSATPIPDQPHQDPPVVVDTRRRLYGSAGTAEVVLLLSKWKSYLGSTSATLSFFKRVVNQASALYTNNNLPSDLEISISWRYAILDDVSCNSPHSCMMESRSYLGTLNYDFDYGFVFQRGTLSGGGQSFATATCGSVNGRMHEYKYGASLTNQAEDRGAKHLAHELGHAIMRRETGKGQTTHMVPGWIMDAGGSGDTWHSQTIAQFRYFKSKGGWDCFKKTGMSGMNGANDYKDKTGYTGGSSGGSTSYGGSSGGSTSYGGGSSGGTSYGGNSGGSTNYGGSSGGSTSYGGGSTNNGGSSGSSYGYVAACIKLYSFSDSASSLNGFWSKTGTDRYDKDGSSMYMSRRGEYWNVNGAWRYGWCVESNILSCSGKWKNGGNGLIRKSSSCDNAFSYPECFDSYANGMCVYGDVLNGNRFDRVDDEGCFNDAPVWRYIDDDADRMYYLHHSNEGAWVVTENGLGDAGVFSCHEEELLECVDGSWVQEVDEDEDATEIEVVEGVYIEACGASLEEEKNASGIAMSSVVIILVILLVIVLIAVGLFVYRNQRAKHLKLEEVMSIEEDEEVDVEVETQLTVTGE